MDDQDDEVKVDQEDQFEQLQVVAEEQPKSKVKSKQLELFQKKLKQRKR